VWYYFWGGEGAKTFKWYSEIIVRDGDRFKNKLIGVMVYF
jgi:hypothetical protein